MVGVDPDNHEFKAPWSKIKNIPRVFTAEDRATRTLNSDTPYSMAGLDPRAEPVVLAVPAIEKSRYFSVQLINVKKVRSATSCRRCRRSWTNPRRPPR